MQICESNQEIKIYFEKWLRFIFFNTEKQKRKQKQTSTQNQNNTHLILTCSIVFQGNIKLSDFESRYHFNI